MQVKSIAAPVEVRASQPSPSAFFLAVGRDVGSFTQLPEEAGPPVWVGLPFGRTMLAAACMAPENDWYVSTAELAEMSADEFRVWVLASFLHVGSDAAERTAGTVGFRSGFAGDQLLEPLFTVLCTRLDTDLFATATSTTATSASTPAPAAGQGRRGRAARSAA